MTLTLNETNALLTKAGIEPIESSIFQKMLSSFKPSLLFSALKGASKDVGAKRWVLNNLEPLLDQANQNNEATFQYSESDVSAPSHQVPEEPPTPDVMQESYQERQAHYQHEPEPQQTAAPDESREYKGHHVYGTAAALYFICSKTKTGIFTLSIDGAVSSGARKFDWAKKVSLQVTQAELPMVSAVLFGFIKSCEFKNHGF